jgi:hypothetical protein
MTAADAAREDAVVAGEGAARWLDLGPTFVRRVLITTGWVGALATICIAVYAGLPHAAAWIAGVALGVAELFLLDALIRETIGARRRSMLVIYGILKFAGIYAVGAAALFALHLKPWFLLSGFTLFLAIAILKVLGRLLLTAPSLQRERHGPGGRLLRNGPRP